jgi:RNA polymerase sigma-54 factor
MSMDLTQGAYVPLGIHCYEVTQVRVASPQLVAANHILALSSAELQALVNREAAENPALEVEENPVCQQCGRPLQGQVCPNCVAPLPGQQNGAANEDAFAEEVMVWPLPSLGAAREVDCDPIAHVAAQVSLAEHVLHSLQAELPAEDGQLVEYLVGNLDADGRLRCSLEEVVDLFDVHPDRVERAIRYLQAMEPIGVGARDLRECLLIQLNSIEQAGHSQPFAREIVSRFLVQLSEHKYGQIAAALGTTTETVQQVSAFIRTNLNPFPARGYLASGGEQASYVLPDVIISRKVLPGGQHTFEVEVVESKRYYLRLSQSYAQLYSDVSNRHAALSEDDRRHIQQYVSRAKLFIANINQRRQTLARITRCLVDLQREFLDRGMPYLEPLTRAEVAFQLGLHESTVSRATAAKYVLLPTGAVIPFSYFFEANRSVKAVIRDLINRETIPLTDQQLANSLRDLNIIVARRTVAAYREQMGILPSSLRRPRGPRSAAPTPDRVAMAPRPELRRRPYQRLAAQARDRATPAARARALLHDLLDEREREQLATHGYLEVPSPSHPQRFYRIPGYSGRVRLYEQGSVVCELCVGPVEPLPRADVVVLHKLMIQGDEEAYLSSANHFPVRRT